MIFVFGSNLAGRHGKGAALEAKNKYAAVYGVGRGRTGNAYALPTKDNNLKPLSLEDIRANIFEFVVYAQQHPEDTFIVTPVGTGLAGYEKIDIAERFRDCMIGLKVDNLLFTSSWFNEDSWWGYY